MYTLVVYIATAHRGDGNTAAILGDVLSFFNANTLIRGSGHIYFVGPKGTDYVQNHL
jgi:hypothetical protein